VLLCNIALRRRNTSRHHRKAPWSIEPAHFAGWSQSLPLEQFGDAFAQFAGARI
jgi:hypothetical protein